MALERLGKACQKLVEACHDPMETLLERDAPFEGRESIWLAVPSALLLWFSIRPQQRRKLFTGDSSHRIVPMDAS